MEINSQSPRSTGEELKDHLSCLCWIVELIVPMPAQPQTLEAEALGPTEQQFKAL